MTGSWCVCCAVLVCCAHVLVCVLCSACLLGSCPGVCVVQCLSVGLMSWCVCCAVLVCCAHVLVCVLCSACLLGSCPGVCVVQCLSVGLMSWCVCCAVLVCCCWAEWCWLLCVLYQSLFPSHTPRCRTQPQGHNLRTESGFPGCTHSSHLYSHTMMHMCTSFGTLNGAEWLLSTRWMPFSLR